MGKSGASVLLMTQPYIVVHNPEPLKVFTNLFHKLHFNIIPLSSIGILTGQFQHQNYESVCVCVCVWNTCCAKNTSDIKLNSSLDTNIGILCEQSPCVNLKGEEIE